MSEAPAEKTVVVTGSTGLIGSSLVRSLRAEGFRVVRAVRGEVDNPEEQLYWNPSEGRIDAGRFEGVDAVVHLAGANVAGERWTDNYKQKILNSRAQGTSLLSETLANLQNKPRVLVSASAIGYYGDRGDERLNEESPPGAESEFLPTVCVNWEAACQAARDAGIRVINPRIGVVLSPDGGALSRMLTPFKMGAGGVVGSGKQYVSWISIDDVVAGLVYLVKNEELSGPVNLTSPNPVTNRELTKTLGEVLSRPTVVPMPAFAARAAFGQLADELLLASSRVIPERLAATDFHYQYPELEPALRHLLQ